MLKTVIFIHILCACIWTGGHLVLSLAVLPKALKKKDFDIIHNFETHYERVGIPALIGLLISGVFMATQYAPSFFDFDIQDHYTRHILIKFVLLLCTIALAIHARFFLIPHKRLVPLAYHIIGVTIISVLFTLVGFSVRAGGIF
jgi:putative copper export protein